MYKILTVVYHETKEHWDMALKSWASFDPDVEIIAVVNRGLEGVIYPPGVRVIHNNENCLAKAWNLGLREIFKEVDYALVSGLDSFAPPVDKLLEGAKQYGFCAATPMGFENGETDVKHGDGSFSMFMISNVLFRNVGDFDERYKPAYFEDNDYLERMWQKGYTPKRRLDVKYNHLFQGSVKFGPEINAKYPEFMQRNLEIFRADYGKVPDHLPLDIRFS